MDNNIERYNLLIKDKGTHGQPALNIHRNFGKSQNQLHNNPPTSIFNFKRTNCRNQRNRVIWTAHSFEDLRRLWTDRHLKYRFLKPGKIKSAFYIIQQLGESVPIQALFPALLAIKRVIPSMAPSMPEFHLLLFVQLFLCLPTCGTNS